MSTPIGITARNPENQALASAIHEVITAAKPHFQKTLDKILVKDGAIVSLKEIVGHGLPESGYCYRRIQAIFKKCQQRLLDEFQSADEQELDLSQFDPLGNPIQNQFVGDAGEIFVGDENSLPHDDRTASNPLAWFPDRNQSLLEEPAVDEPDEKKDEESPQSAPLDSIRRNREKKRKNELVQAIKQSKRKRRKVAKKATKKRKPKLTPRAKLFQSINKKKSARSGRIAKAIIVAIASAFDLVVNNPCISYVLKAKVVHDSAVNKAGTVSFVHTEDVYANLFAKVRGGYKCLDNELKTTCCSLKDVDVITVLTKIREYYDSVGTSAASDEDMQDVEESTDEDISDFLASE